MMRRSFLVPLVLATVFTVVGCSFTPEPQPAVVLIPVSPQPPPAGVAACMDALASGELVADARWGVALGQVDGPTIQVMWPAGYSARQMAGMIELLDERGVVVARVGDAVTIGGGFGAGNAWWACGAPNRGPLPVEG
jgi:hypothetical protein